MAPNISVREYIRWVPEAQSEPTSTLVLTSSQHRFVDVRILKSLDGGDLQAAKRDVLPLSQLDWALAGTSSTSFKKDKHGEQVLHSKWHHWVDSRTADTETVTDEGDMYPQPDGTTLERGSMVNPATGREVEYEESWRDIAPTATTPGDKKGCIVLQLHDDAHVARGVVIRLGQFCQGMLRVGSSISVERWEWLGDKGGWKRQLRIGDFWMPCGPAMDSERLAVGGEVKYGDYCWTVVELEHF